jgi:hypothetical protein
MWRLKNDLHITHRLDDYEQFFHLSAAKSCPNYRDQLRGAVRQERLGHVDARTTMGYTHLVTADDVRIAGELGALLDKEFLAQDLPKFPPNVKTASKSHSEAI